MIAAVGKIRRVRIEMNGRCRRFVVGGTRRHGLKWLGVSCEIGKKRENEDERSLWPPTSFVRGHAVVHLKTRGRLFPSSTF